MHSGIAKWLILLVLTQTPQELADAEATPKTEAAPQPNADADIPATIKRLKALVDGKPLADGDAPPVSTLLGIPIRDPDTLRLRATEFEKRSQLVLEEQRGLRDKIAVVEANLAEARAPSAPPPPPVVPVAPPPEGDPQTPEGASPTPGDTPPPTDDPPSVEGDTPTTESPTPPQPEPDPVKIEALEVELKTLNESLQQALSRAELYELRAKVTTTLSKGLSRLPAPALQSFGLLARGRDPVRLRAEELEQTATALEDLVGRLHQLSNSAKSGRLMGFASRRVSTAGDIDAAAGGIASRTTSMQEAGASLRELLRSQEEGAGELHRALVLHLASQQQESIDTLFVAHLTAQRKLRKLLSQRASTDAANLDAIYSETKRLASEIERVQTLPDADEVATGANEVASHIDGGLELMPVETLRWQLAFERELVTILRPLASEAVQKRVSGLSAELIDDIRIEAEEAWRGTEVWFTKIVAEIQEIPQIWETFLYRTLLVLALIMLGWLAYTKRINPVSRVVRFLVRHPKMRGRARTIVQWANLVQTVFPQAALFGAIYAALHAVGMHRPSAQFMEVPVRWIGLYVLGRQFLMGLTKPVSRGRPALLDASQATIDRLRSTYSRVGAMLTVLFIANDLAEGWFGVGRLLVLINSFMSLWLIIWALWAVLLWRIPIAEAILETSPPTTVEKLARWTKGNRLGCIFSLPGAIFLTVRGVIRFGSKLAARSGLLAYVRAKTLRRAAMGGEDKKEPPPQLPDSYKKEFPLYPLIGDTDAVVLPRDALLTTILEQVQTWRESRNESSMVVVGEKGTGKTTLLGLLDTKLPDLDVLELSLNEKCITERSLIAALNPSFGANAGSLKDLEQAILDGPERVIVLDEAHNTFLRVPRGYAGFDALVDLVNATSERVFWVVVFNTFSWEFINEIRGRTHYFRRLLALPEWKSSELQDLIDRRNRRSGFNVQFDAALLDKNVGTDFELVDEAEGYFRLLWETSRGNPRVALTFWLRSLTVLSENTLTCSLFRVPAMSSVPGLTDELVFVLAAVCQHENLSIRDLEQVLRIKRGKARFAVKFLVEQHLLELKHGTKDRYTLAPEMYPETLRYLRGKHLLFEGS